MDANEFKFKITNKLTGESAEISLNDIFGYEGEECGVFVRHDIEVPDSIKDFAINYNSGFGNHGISEHADFEFIKEKTFEVHREPTYGFIRKDDFGKIISACKTIGDAIFNPPGCGMTIDGVDYVPADIISEPKDIEAALKLLCDYFGVK